MFEAIHKDSKKLVSAYKLEKDISWAGKDKDEFIASPEQIGNWIELKNKGITEVKVTFVKTHIRDGIWVRSYFRIITEEAIYSPVFESEEHKLAKDTIYSACVSDSITLKNFNKKLSYYEIDDVRIEKGSGNMRADVLVDFKKRDAVLGRGIAFEIQISPQTKDRTKYRSYDRAAEDYSIVWIWGDEISDNLEFNVETVADCIRSGMESLKVQFDNYLAVAGQKAELKQLEIREDINRMFMQEENKIKNKFSQVMTLPNKIDSLYSSLSTQYSNIASTQQEFIKRIEKDLENIKEEAMQRISIEGIKINSEWIEKVVKETINTGRLDIQVKDVINQSIEDIIKQIKEFNIPEFMQTKLELVFTCEKCKVHIPYRFGCCEFYKMQPYCISCYNEIKKTKG